MEYYVLNQFGWANKRDYYSDLKSAEESAKLECLAKKQAAAVAAENVSFFLEQCADGLSLIESAAEKAENVTENTVKKYVDKFNDYHTDINSYLSQLSGLETRLLNIESMYQKMAQNHMDNYDVCQERWSTCNTCESQAIYGNYYDQENQRTVYGTVGAYLTGEIKDEMDGVVWVE